jgi:hypothetical protein
MEKTNDYNEKLNKIIQYVSKFSGQQKERLLVLLLKVQEIQKSDISTAEKATDIKRILWKEQSTKSKLFIGGFLGTLAGLFIFGTGGIGIAGLGGAIGVWGFLAGTAGGVLVSSLIQNFEKNKND